MMLINTKELDNQINEQIKCSHKTVGNYLYENNGFKGLTIPEKIEKLIWHINRIN